MKQTKVVKTKTSSTEEKRVKEGSEIIWSFKRTEIQSSMSFIRSDHNAGLIKALIDNCPWLAKKFVDLMSMIAMNNVSSIEDPNEISIADLED